MASAQGIRAGAVGFSTSRALAHKTLAGVHTPTLGAPEAELETIGRAIGAELAAEYGIRDDGDRQPPSYRDLHGIHPIRQFDRILR